MVAAELQNRSIPTLQLPGNLWGAKVSASTVLRTPELDTAVLAAWQKQCKMALSRDPTSRRKLAARTPKLCQGFMDQIIASSGAPSHLTHAAAAVMPALTASFCVFRKTDNYNNYYFLRD